MFRTFGTELNVKKRGDLLKIKGGVCSVVLGYHCEVQADGLAVRWQQNSEVH